MNKLEHEVILPSIKDDGTIDTGGATQWCQAQWGERWCPIANREGRWACFWTGKNNPMTFRYCFADERDLVLFLLRWA